MAAEGEKLKKFMIKLITAAAVAALILGYNSVTSVHVQADEAAKAEYDAAVAAAEAASGTGWTDGTYRGTAMGFGGDITVEVTIEGGVMTDLTIVSADKEDSAYLETAKEIIQDILDAQSADVDTISGATFSSAGIRDAAGLALEEASD